MVRYLTSLKLFAAWTASTSQSCKGGLAHLRLGGQLALYQYFSLIVIGLCIPQSACPGLCRGREGLCDLVLLQLSVWTGTQISYKEAEETSVSFQAEILASFLKLREEGYCETKVAAWASFFVLSLYFMSP